MAAELFEEIKYAQTDVEKFNPYHDSKGRFSSAGGAASFTIRTRDPAKQSWAEAGIDREKKRTAAMDGKKGKDNPEKAKAKPKPKGNSKPKQKANTGGLDEKGVPRGQVKGKDISESFQAKIIKNPSGTTVSLADQVADLQGYKGKPTVVSKDEFDQAAKNTGVIAYRTINQGNDYITNSGMTSTEFAKQLMYGKAKDFALNADGGQAYGGGIYMAANERGDVDRFSGEPRGTYARSSSTAYAWGKDNTVVKMTLSPTAKIADYNVIAKQLRNAPQNIRNNFGGDIGAYAAALGYDGVRAEGAGWNSDYVMVTNRTALIICDEVEDVSGTKTKRVTA